MLGKRSWLRWVDRWVDVWTEVDHRKLTQTVILHRTERHRAVPCSGASYDSRGHSGGDSEPAYLIPKDSAGMIFISTKL